MIKFSFFAAETGKSFRKLIVSENEMRTKKEAKKEPHFLSEKEEQERKSLQKRNKFGYDYQIVMTSTQAEASFLIL